MRILFGFGMKLEGQVRERPTREPANEGGIVADNSHQYRGRSRTCFDATARILGRSHRFKLLR